jgi:hypothetical protein
MIAIQQIEISFSQRLNRRRSMLWNARTWALAALAAIGFAAPIRADLVAYYSFDDIVEDGSGNGNDPSVVSGGNFITDVPSQIGSGKAFAMDGAASGFSVPDSPSLDITGGITISAWVNMDDLLQWNVIAAKQPSGTAPTNWPGNFELRISPTAGQLQFLHQTSEGQTLGQYGSTINVVPIEWTHLLVTVADGGNASFYVNGISAGSFPTAGPFGVLNDNPMLVGQRADGLSQFRGYMDDLAIWNEVLGPGQIGALAAGGDPTDLPDFNPADINLDGVVNTSDYEILRDNFGTGTTFEQGDIDFNGTVDGRDFRILKNNFGIGGSGLTVPEPSSALLMSIGAVLGLYVWRRR